jgi:hypothetical protein
MKIILANGVELHPITAMGASDFIQGASRDVLSFVFPAEASMDELDAIFTAENCETITVAEGADEHIHKGYTIRAELKRNPVEVSPATASAEAVYENRVTVAMAQRTYTETQMAAMQQAMAALLKEE